MWQPLATIALTTEWQYTTVTDAIYFRIRNLSTNTSEKGYLAQVYEDDGIKDIFLGRTIYPFLQGEIIALPYPLIPNGNARLIGLRKSKRNGNNINNPWTLQLDYMPLSLTELPNTSMTSNSAVETVVAASTSPVVILAANTARKGFSIYNTSNSPLYIKFGAYGNNATQANAIGTSSVRIPPNGVYECPINYTGVIGGVFQTTNGNAQIAEFV